MTILLLQRRNPQADIIRLRLKRPKVIDHVEVLHPMLPEDRVEAVPGVERGEAVVIVLVAGHRQLVTGESKGGRLAIESDSEGDRPGLVELGTQRPVPVEEIRILEWSHRVDFVDVLFGDFDR